MSRPVELPIPPSYLDEISDDDVPHHPATHLQRLQTSPHMNVLLLAPLIVLENMF